MMGLLLMGLVLVVLGVGYVGYIIFLFDEEGE